MKTQELETERLILRKFTWDDEEDIFNNWGSNDEVSKYVRWTTHKTIEDTREYLKTVMKTYEEAINAEWAITIKDTNELIGSMVCFYNAEEKRYEIGYNIAQKHWRKGYTSEALKTVMKYLINEEHITSFICEHATANPASGAVMRKVGFKYVRDTICEKYDGSRKFETKVYYLDTIN